MPDAKSYLAICYRPPRADSAGGYVMMPVDTCDPDDVFMQLESRFGGELWSWPIIVKNGGTHPEAVNHSTENKLT
jgi:hypothetical protein